jgi:hypothetical protein
VQAVLCGSLTTALEGGERSVVTHWTGGWVGPRASLDVVAADYYGTQFKLMRTEFLGVSVKCGGEKCMQHFTWNTSKEEITWYTQA